MSNKFDIVIDVKSKGVGEFTKLGQKTKELETELGKLKDIDSLKKLAADMKKSGQAFETSQQKVVALAREINAAEKPTKKLTNEYNKAKNETIRLAKEQTNAKNKFYALRDELKKSGVDTKNLNQEQRNLKTGLTSLTASVQKYKKEVVAGQKLDQARGLLDVRPYKEVQKEITQLNAAYARLKNSGKLSAKELYTAQSQLQRKTEELKRSTTDWSGSMSEARNGLIGLAVVGYTAVKAFSSYSSYAQKMAEVNTLLDISNEKHQALSNEIVNISKEIPQTANELAQAEYNILSAGVSLGKSTDVLKLSAKAAVAGVTDTNTAVQAGVGVINAYGKDISALDNVYDILFMTVKKGVTTFPELGKNIGEVLPSAKAAGVNFEEVSGAIAAMTKAGLRTPLAATALRGAINAMAAPTPEAKKKFEELGITWQGFIPTLEAIAEKGLAVDEMRFLIPDVEARTGVLSLTQNIEGLKNTIGEMEAAGGVMEEAYAKMEDTPENRIKILKNNLNELLMGAGEVVSRGLLPLGEKLIWVSQGMVKADGVTQTLIATIATATTGALLWNIGLKQMAMGLKGLVVSIQSVTAAKIKDTAATEANAEATATATAATTKLGLATKALSFAGAIYGLIQIARLAKVAWGALEASHEAEAAQKRVLATADKIIKKYGEFAFISIPPDLTKLAQEDLKKLQSELHKSKAYWTATNAAAEQTNDTELIKESIQKLDELNATLAKVKGEYDKTAQAAKDAGDASKQNAELEKKVAEQMLKAKINGAKESLALYKSDTESRKKELSKQLVDIELAEAEGVLTAEDAGAKKLNTEKKWLDERLARAKQNTDDIETAYKEGSKEREKALKENADEIEDIETDLKKFRIKELNSLTEEQKEAEQKRKADVEAASTAIMQIITQETAARSAEHQKQIAEIGLAEAQGIIPHKEALEEKQRLEIKFAEFRVKQAEKVVDALIEAGKKDTDAYEKAIEKKIQLEADLLKTKAEMAKLDNEIDDKKDADEDDKAEKTKRQMSMYVSGYNELSDSLATLNSEIEKFQQGNVISGNTIKFLGSQSQIDNTLKALNDYRDGFIAVAQTAKDAGLDVDLYNDTFKSMNIEDFKKDIEDRVKGFEAFKESIEATRQSIGDLVSDTKNWDEHITEGVSESEKAFDAVLKKTKDITGDMQAVWQAYNESSVKDAEALAADVIKSYEELATTGAKHLAELEGAWDDLEKEIESVFKTIDKLNADSQDTIRNLRRDLMTEEQQWQDKRLEYDEKMQAARIALQQGDVDNAVELFEEAKSLAEDLATTVEDENGQVISSIEENTNTSINLIEQATTAATDALSQQADTLKTQQQDTRTEIDKTVSSLTRMQGIIASMGSGGNTGSGILANNIQTGFNSGGSVPGVGSTDTIPAMLTPGEFVNPKGSVQKYGTGIFEALRRQIVPKEAIASLLSGKRYNLGGLVSNWKIHLPEMPEMKFNTGGVVPSQTATERIQVDLNINGKSYPAMFAKQTGQAFIDELKAAQSRAL